MAGRVDRPHRTPARAPARGRLPAPGPRPRPSPPTGPASSGPDVRAGAVRRPSQAGDRGWPSPVQEAARSCRPVHAGTAGPGRGLPNSPPIRAAHRRQAARRVQRALRPLRTVVRALPEGGGSRSPTCSGHTAPTSASCRRETPPPWRRRFRPELTEWRATTAVGGGTQLATTITQIQLIAPTTGERCAYRPGKGFAHSPRTGHPIRNSTSSPSMTVSETRSRPTCSSCPR